MVLDSWLTRVPEAGVALDDDVDLDGHLLAAAHDDQVDVLDVAADRVDLQRLGQRERFRAVDVEGEHGVGAGVAQHGGEVAGGEHQVLRVGAVAVEDGGDLAVAAGRREAPLPVSVRTSAVRLLAWAAVLAMCVAPVPCSAGHGQGRNFVRSGSRR